MGRFLAAVAVVLVLWSAPAQAQTASNPPDPARVALAREVVAVVGADKLFLELLQTTQGDFTARVMASGQYDAAGAQRVWEIFVEEVEAGTPAFLEEIAQVYAREFTEDQLRDLLAFWTSPTGRIVSSKQMSLMMAGQRAGAALGARAGLGAEQRYREELQRGRNRT